MGDIGIAHFVDKTNPEYTLLASRRIRNDLKCVECMGR